ncbi:MAG TPA: hypothetical protein PLU72_08120 [Candidatus Ozemobacteraceae bacterium]|nr:hypothetical protein [Candidatus Ozemobacteraceae bacterium]
MNKLLVMIVGILCFATAVSASEIALLPLKELPLRANLIVLGEVLRVVPQNNENLDTVTIRIHAILKGDVKDPEATFVLSTRGGLKDFDPQVKPGDMGVFFLDHQNGAFKKAYWGSIALFAKNNFTDNSDAVGDEAATLFPRIGTEDRKTALSFIASYGINQGWKPLPKNTLRILIQPMGTVSGAFEVDLESGRAIAFPPTHFNVPRAELHLNTTVLKELRRLLESTEFRNLKSRGSKVGLDGTTYFLEVDMDDRYQWLLHWQPEEFIIKAIAELVSGECKKYEQK